MLHIFNKLHIFHFNFCNSTDQHSSCFPFISNVEKRATVLRSPLLWRGRERLLALCIDLLPFGEIGRGFDLLSTSAERPGWTRKGYCLLIQLFMHFFCFFHRYLQHLSIVSKKTIGFNFHVRSLCIYGCRQTKFYHTR